MIPGQRLAALAASLMLVIASCANTGDAATDGPIVVTTVAPITSVVSSIVGDRAQVIGIIPEGTNSHTFEPSPSAAAVLARADVVFINGLLLEEPTKRLAATNVRAGVPLVELGNLTISEAQYNYDFSFPESQGKPNPHLWTDPNHVRTYAAIVSSTMADIDPHGAAHYQANLAAFTAVLDEFDRAIDQAFGTIADENRKLVTYHDAYSYFAESYGWTVIGAIQPADFGEPTPREVVELIEQVKRENVPAIFGSEIFPSPVLEQVANETGTTYVSDLRDDDLPGEPGDPEHSWLGLMRFNFITMTEALGGDASALVRFDARAALPDTAIYPQ